MVAGLQLAEQRRRHRRHAARCAPRSLRTFQRAHARLEHADGGVGVSAVDEAFLVALEARFGLLGVVVYIAGVEEDRLGGLAELAPHGALVHELGRWTPSALAGLGTLLRRHGQNSPVHVRGTKKPDSGCRQKTGIGATRLARPFSDLFNVV